MQYRYLVSYRAHLFIAYWDGGAIPSHRSSFLFRILQRTVSAPHGYLVFVSDQKGVKITTTTCDVCNAAVRKSHVVMLHNTTNLIEHLEKFSRDKHLQFLPANHRRDTKRLRLAEALRHWCYFTVVAVWQLNQDTRFTSLCLL